MSQDLIQRLNDEADLCRNDGADDIARLLDEAAAALGGHHESNAKLLALADRIDHQELWRQPLLDHDKMTPQQKDQLAAGVALRRYADLLGEGGWRIYPPRAGLSFRAGTLDAVLEMARNEEARRAADGQPLASAEEA